MVPKLNMARVMDVEVWRMGGALVGICDVFPKVEIEFLMFEGRVEQARLLRVAGVWASSAAIVAVCVGVAHLAEVGVRGGGAFG